METLVDVHSWLRWLVLAVLVFTGIAAIVSSRRADAPYVGGLVSAAVMVVDVQVALGLVVWLFNEGWSQGAFFAVIHPLVMLFALGLAHVLAKRTRATAGDGETALANRVAGVGMLVVLALVVAAVPWFRL